MNNPIRIAIVDPYEIVRESLILLFKHYPDLLFVGEARVAQDMLSLCGLVKPDVVVFDFASKAEDIGVIRQLRKLYPRVKVLVLTANPDMQCAISAIRAGVNGYLYKEIDSDALQQAIIGVFNNKPMFDEDIGKIVSV